MSTKYLGIILFSFFLIFATAPIAPAMQYSKQEKAGKQKETGAMPEKGMPEKGKQTDTMQKKEMGKDQKDVKPATGEEKKSTMKSGQEKKSKTGEQKAGPKAGTKKDHGATHDKRSGMHSKQQIREVQTALKKEGFNPGPIDGVVGVLTITALRDFQSHNGLQVTGKIDEPTQTALHIEIRPAEVPEASNRVEPETKSTQTNPAQQTTPARPAGIGGGIGPTAYVVDDVKSVQIALKNRGYDPGDINGMMSSQTLDAIRQFQTANNLPVTGVLDQRTQMALGVTVKGTEPQEELSLIDKQTGSDFNIERTKPAATEETQADKIQSMRKQMGSTTAQERDKDRDKDKDKDQAKADKDRDVGKVDKDVAERVSKAAAVLQDLTSAADKRIPNELLARAEAIAVIPNMIKGALGIGGRYGKGVVSQRLDSGRWSPPAFISIGGGSFGAQLGVSSTDVVLIFTDKKALSMLEGGKDLKLGVDASIVAGPTGRSAEAGVNANLESGIYAYSRAKGLFAGIALDGAVLDMDNDTNAKVYGHHVTAKGILNGKVQANATVRPFVDAIDRVVPKKKMTQK